MCVFALLSPDDRVAPEIAILGLPQIRACGISALGSSKHC